MTLLLLFALHVSDEICQRREWRCIERCNAHNTIGSMEHLNCKTECREDYLHCREER
jgi:hypothetical protein